MKKIAKCDQEHRGLLPPPRLWLVALLCLSVTAPGWSASLADVIDKIRPSIVGVGTAYPPRQPNRKSDAVTYRGTGFVVGNGRQVLTNAHVIPAELDTDHNQFIAVFAGRGAKARALSARVVRSDPEHDLALLEIDGPALQLWILEIPAGCGRGRKWPSRGSLLAWHWACIPLRTGAWSP